jgi:hypothetical protein
MKLSNKHYFPEVLALLLFAVVLPITLNVHFMQNDDWVYYANVQAFLKGNFALNPLVAPTFYTQGILATVFALLFGVLHLPVLTALVSVLNFYVFARILIDRLKLKTFDASLLSLLFFLNPLHIYSMLGFMTENYFLLFTLIAIYYILAEDLVRANVFILFSFFVRQLGLITSLSFALALLVSKKYKEFTIQLGLFVLLAGFYAFIFPKTPAMFTKQINFQPLVSNPRGTFSLLYVILIYVAASTLPLLFLVRRKTKLWVALVVFVAVFLLANKLFTPRGMPHDLFPYLDNTWYANGFYQPLDGTKYSFLGMSYMYKLWDLLAKLAVAALPVVFFFIKKHKLNFFSFYIVLYIGFLLPLSKVYDRYFLLLIPLTILLAAFLYVHNTGLPFSKLFRIVTVAFVLFLFGYAYEFTMDFLTLNNYIWSRSQQLVRTNSAPANQIHATYTWNKVYPRLVPDYASYDYLFSFQKIKAAPWQLVEAKTLKFPLSIYKSPVVYLYRNEIN